MIKYKVRFQFTNAFFGNNKFDDVIESNLPIKEFTNQLQKELIAKKEMYRVIQVNKLENTI